YDGRPVVALSVGYRSGWNAWTVLPRERFGIGHYSAHRYAIEPSRLASTTPFIVHRSAPAMTPGRVTAVGPVPSQSSGVAVPRYDPRGGDYRSPYRAPSARQAPGIQQGPTAGPRYAPNGAPNGARSSAPAYDPQRTYRDRQTYRDPQIYRDPNV